MDERVGVPAVWALLHMHSSCNYRGVPALDELLLLLVPHGDDRHEVLEAFIAARLAEAGTWSSHRTSDGVDSCRMVERTTHRVRLCGRIWEIAGQTLHTFWLDFEREQGALERTRWTLYFDVLLTSASARRVRDAADVLEHPEEVQWRVALSGDVVARDGALEVSRSASDDVTRDR